MTLYNFLLFLPGVLSGMLIIHLIWREGGPFALLLKASLGTGLGLGINSIFYFFSLVIAPGKLNILPLMLALLAVLLILTIRQKGKWHSPLPYQPRLSPLQWTLTAMATLATGLLLISFLNLVKGLPQGAFDSWSIWNRTARFIFRDTENWKATLSPELHPGAHPDYPLLIPLNVAWGWQSLGQETDRTPQVQALLFMLASVGLIYSSLGLARSPGQAGLGTLLLSGTPLFVLTASGLLADAPIMYFISASTILIYLALTRGEGKLMILAGFMAGLAAWTKNEGLLFLLTGALGLGLTRFADLRGSLLNFALGATFPLAVVLFLKSLAPPGDLFSANNLAQLTDLSRYWIILRTLGEMALHFGDWPFSLPLALLAYALVVQPGPPPGSNRSIFTIAAILGLQFLGYMAVYLLSPYDLQWHLTTSVQRVLLQLFAAGVFLYFLVLREPEAVFAEQPGAVKR